MIEHAKLTAQLRDIGDALRSTNLIRGRQIHQLADDLEAALADAEREARLDEAKWWAERTPTSFIGPDKQARIAALSLEASEEEYRKMFHYAEPAKAFAPPMTTQPDRYDEQKIAVAERSSKP